jgi:hypothetical protein
MFDIATKKRLTLGKTTIRELSGDEGVLAGGAARAPIMVTPRASAVCAVTVGCTTKATQLLCNVTVGPACTTGLSAVRCAATAGAACNPTAVSCDSVCVCV